MDKKKINNRQAIYFFIVKYKMEHDGNSPTYREIMAAIGLSSSSTAAYYLNQLEEAGFIIRSMQGGNSRVIEVPGGFWVPPDSDVIDNHYLRTGEIPKGVLSCLH